MDYMPFSSPFRLFFLIYQWISHRRRLIDWAQYRIIIPYCSMPILIYKNLGHGRRKRYS